jgi:hypothetical protein
MRGEGCMSAIVCVVGFWGLVLAAVLLAWAW